MVAIITGSLPLLICFEFSLKSTGTEYAKGIPEILELNNKVLKFSSIS